MENNGLRIRGFDFFERAESAALGRFVGGIEDEIGLTSAEVSRRPFWNFTLGFR